MILHPTLSLCVRFQHMSIQSLIAFIVIEPSIRMSWIEDNWDEAYVVKAKKTVIDLVGIELAV